METMHAAGRRRLPPVPRPAGDRSVSGLVAAAATDDANTDQFATQVIDTRQIAADLVEAELAALTEATGDRDAAGADDAVVDDDAIDVTEQLPLAELVALIYDADGDDDDESDDDEVAADDAPEASTEESAEDESTTDDEAETPVEAPATPEVVAGEVDMPAAPVEAPVDDQDPAQQFVARLRTSAADFALAAGAESAVVREAVPPARHRRARCRLVLRYTDGDVADVTLLGPAGAPGRPSRHGFDRQILRWLGAGLVQDDAWVVDDPDAPDGVAVDLSAWAAAG